MPADAVVKSETRAPATGRLGGLFAHGDKRWFSALIGLVLAVLVLPPLLFLVHGAVTITAPGGGGAGLSFHNHIGGHRHILT